MISGYTWTECHAQAWIGLEWEIKHEVNVEAFGEAFRFCTIRCIQPACITELYKKVVVCTIA